MSDCAAEHDTIQHWGEQSTNTLTCEGHAVLQPSIALCRWTGGRRLHIRTGCCILAMARTLLCRCMFGSSLAQQAPALALCLLPWALPSHCLHCIEEAVNLKQPRLQHMTAQHPSKCWTTISGRTTESNIMIKTDGGAHVQQAAIEMKYSRHMCAAVDLQICVYKS